jgi:S-adenosylmethionine:tRNA ribosyltransferase-isomerase
VFAASVGAVAAPTAGLHFTQRLLAELRGAGVSVAEVTLHVGLGTFAPVEVDDLNDHRMHAEWFDLPAATVEQVQAARQAGGRIVAVGTTSVRVLESRADEDGRLAAGSGWTCLLIQPPYRFRVVDALLTNFHLPRSTLLALVCAFAGRDCVMQAYRAAIERGYRFYSYGDAMLIE